MTHEKLLAAIENATLAFAALAEALRVGDAPAPTSPPGGLDPSGLLRADARMMVHRLGEDGGATFIDHGQIMLLGWELDGERSPYRLARRDVGQIVNVTGPKPVVLELPGQLQPKSGDGQLAASHLHPNWQAPGLLRFVFSVEISHPVGLSLVAVKGENNEQAVLRYMDRKYRRLTFKGREAVDQLITIEGAGNTYKVFTSLAPAESEAAQ